MAKQCGDVFFTGTIDGVCFYKMNGEYYARISNPLTARRVKHDPAFAGLMQYAQAMKKACPMASALYKTLPEDKRTNALRRSLIGVGIDLFRKGVGEERVYEILAEAVEVLRKEMEEVAGTEVSVNDVVVKRSGKSATSYTYPGVIIRSFSMPLTLMKQREGRRLRKLRRC